MAWRQEVIGAIERMATRIDALERDLGDVRKRLRLEEAAPGSAFAAGGLSDLFSGEHIVVVRVSDCAEDGSAATGIVQYMSDTDHYVDDDEFATGVALRPGPGNMLFDGAICYARWAGYLQYEAFAGETAGFFAWLTGDAPEGDGYYEWSSWPVDEFGDYRATPLTHANYGDGNAYALDLQRRGWDPYLFTGRTSYNYIGERVGPIWMIPRPDRPYFWGFRDPDSEQCECP